MVIRTGRIGLRQFLFKVNVPGLIYHPVCAERVWKQLNTYFSSVTILNTKLGQEVVKTATEVGVRAIQDHKVIEWNTCWKCRLSEGTDDM